MEIFLLAVSEETIPNGKIEAKIINKKNNFLANQNIESGNGKFTFSQKGLSPGRYFVLFKVTDSRGAQSEWSEPIEVKVVGNIRNLRGFASHYQTELLFLVAITFTILIILVTRDFTIRKVRRDMEIK